MSLLDLHTDDILAAAPRLIQPPKAESRYSVWRDLPVDIGRTMVGVGYGVAQAAAEVAATGADIAAGLRYVRDATPEQRKQMDRTGVPVSAMSSDLGDALRDAAASFRPDPTTASQAEQILQGFARGASKVVAGAMAAGPVGVLLAGGEEAVTQSDALRRQGVDIDTRFKVGAVQGAGLALAALPAAGQTLAGTAALYLAGGPGGYMAQQALTREILQRGGYAKQAAEYDPFDPLGLTISALIPAPFAIHGFRASKAAAAARTAEEFRAGPIPSERTAVAAAAQEAVIPREVSDAALVAHLAERRAAANLGDAAQAGKHEAALTKAEEQINAGERVQVADSVMPSIITGAQRDANFRAWFGDSKVVDGEGRPLVVYHGTAEDVAGFDLARAGSNGQDFGRAIFATSDPKVASGYAVDLRKDAAYLDLVSREEQALNRYAKSAVTDGVGSDAFNRLKAEHEALSAERQAYAARGNTFEVPTTGSNVMPVHVSMLNPLEVDGAGGYFWQVYPDALERARAEGNDGVIVRNVRDHATTETAAAADVFIAFRPEQIKSATGNSGRFDPNSASLTDPLPEFGAAVRALQETRTDAPTPTRTPNPEAAAPARGARAEPAAGPADAGRPATTLEAAGVAPGAKAEQSAAGQRIQALEAQNPDMMVMLDGMDKPMRLADFLAAVKAEADEMTADAPLVELAAQCALVNGL